MTFKEYSDKFLRESLHDVLSGRFVHYKDERDPNRRYTIKSRENDYLKVMRKTQSHTFEISECRLVPETGKEFAIVIADLQNEIDGLTVKIDCLAELGLDKISEEEFIVWKLMKAIEKEKDPVKLRKLLVDNLNL
jgi:hypothetical protein